jgi:hypothetical protein
MYADHPDQSSAVRTIQVRLAADSSPDQSSKFVRNDDDAKSAGA